MTTWPSASPCQCLWWMSATDDGWVLQYDCSRVNAMAWVLWQCAVCTQYQLARTDLLWSRMESLVHSVLCHCCPERLWQVYILYKCKIIQVSKLTQQALRKPRVWTLMLYAMKYNNLKLQDNWPASSDDLHSMEVNWYEKKSISDDFHILQNAKNWAWNCQWLKHWWHRLAQTELADWQQDTNVQKQETQT